MLLRDLRLLQFLAVNGDFNLFSFLLQSFQPLFCGGSKNALLYGVEHILYAVLYLFQTSIELRQLGVLLRKNVQDRIGNVVDEFVVHDDFHDVMNDGVLDPIFLYGLFAASHLTFGVGALIIAMNGSRVALAALSNHERAAFAAKQSRRQDVVILRLTHGGGLLIPRHDLLHAVEQLFGNNRRNGVWDHHIAEFVLSDIPPVFEKVVDDVERDLVSLRRANAAPRQVFGNVGHSLAVGIAGENLHDDGSGRFVDFQALVFHAIAERQTAAVHLAL